MQRSATHNVRPLSEHAAALSENIYDNRFFGVFCCLRPNTVNQNRPLRAAHAHTYTFDVGKVPKAAAYCIRHAPSSQFGARSERAGGQLISQSAVDSSAYLQRCNFCLRLPCKAVANNVLRVQKQCELARVRTVISQGHAVTADFT